MSIHLFQKLQEKVEQAIETIGLLRLHLEESETRNADLQAEINELKNRQREWEQSLSSLLQKLTSTDFSVNASLISAAKMKFAEESYLEKEETAV